MAAWATKFTSPVFRLLIVTWKFFSMTAFAPLVLLFAILLLALYSWFYLDLGLAEYCEYSPLTFLPPFGCSTPPIVKAEEPPHPADKVRWSLAITSDAEKGRSPVSDDGSMEPQIITWVHLPAPIIVKAPLPPQKAARSNSTSSVSSDRTTRSVASSLFTRSRSVSPESNRYPLPPPGLTPAPWCLPLTSVATSPKEASAAVPPSIPPPPQAMTRSLPALLDAAGVRHRIPDDSIVPKRHIDVPPRPLRVNGIPSTNRPSQKNRF
jgi:hypothetical protein